ncbi:hypothetical protein MTO96_039976 [Rhipicephalus appendiculatus]
MSRFHLSQEVLFNCMASVVNCAAQRPSRRLEPVELIVKFKMCDKRQYELLTGCVKFPLVTLAAILFSRLKHSPNPRFRACVVGDERHIREAVANHLDFLDFPALKEISKIPAVARVIAQKYDAFLVSKPLLRKFNAYFGYALAGANKAPPLRPVCRAARDGQDRGGQEYSQDTQEARRACGRRGSRDYAARALGAEREPGRDAPDPLAERKPRRCRPLTLHQEPIGTQTEALLN